MYFQNEGEGGHVEKSMVEFEFENFKSGKYIFEFEFEFEFKLQVRHY